MNNTYLSKSSYCSCVQCEKILWLNKFKSHFLSKENNETIFEKGRKVGELAKGLFGDYEDISVDEKLSVRLEKTEKSLQDKPIL